MYKILQDKNIKIKLINEPEVPWQYILETLFINPINWTTVLFRFRLLNDINSQPNIFYKQETEQTFKQNQSARVYFHQTTTTTALGKCRLTTERTNVPAEEFQTTNPSSTPHLDFRWIILSFSHSFCLPNIHIHGS